MTRQGMGQRMGGALERVSGPYFSFLVCEKDPYWERRGRVQRIVGIRKEFHHHPEALRLPDSVVSLAMDCFRDTGDRFNPYGYTVYGADALEELADCLVNQVEQVRTCDTLETFTARLTPIFLVWGLQDVPAWREHWTDHRDETAYGIDAIVRRARRARAEGKVLLVLEV